MNLTIFFTHRKKIEEKIHFMYLQARNLAQIFDDIFTFLYSNIDATIAHYTQHREILHV